MAPTVTLNHSLQCIYITTATIKLIMHTGIVLTVILHIISQLIMHTGIVLTVILHIISQLITNLKAEHAKLAQLCESKDMPFSLVH